jgi:hypothetical protein
LDVRVPEAGWSFLVRRIDFAPDPLFERFHGKEFHSHDLARLLPEWASLRWVEVPTNILSDSESSARGEHYQINIRAEPGGRMTQGEVVAAFLAFMAQS